MNLAIRYIFLIVIANSFLCSAYAQSAKQKMNAAQRKVKLLKKEMDAIQKDLKELENLEIEASQDYVREEIEMKNKMKEAVVPLLNWSSRSDDFRLKSWIEREHQVALLESTKARLVREPTNLLKQRKDRLDSIKLLREESSAKLQELETRQSLLQTQIEEWRRFQKAPVKKSETAKSTGATTAPSSGQGPTTP